MWETLHSTFSLWDVDNKQREVTAYDDGSKPGCNNVLLSKITRHPCLKFGLRKWTQ